MAVLVEIIGSLLTLCGVTFFGYLYFASKRRMDEEHGLVPIYCEQCGGSFGGWGLTPPFARIAVYDRFMVVAIGGTRYLLQSSDIQGTSPEWHLLQKGIRIKHWRTDIPQYLVIWSWHPVKVTKAIYELMITIRPN